MIEAAWRSALLLSFCGAELRLLLKELEELETVLALQLERASRKWPDPILQPEEYLQHLADALHHSRISDPVKHLVSLESSDFYLAAAVLRNCDGAVERFHTEMRPPLRRALQKLTSDTSTCDEIEQQVFDNVLVGERPQLANYSGRGALSSWIVTIGVRTCRRHLGAEDKHAGDKQALELAVDEGDVELAYLKHHYREQFRDAFSETAALLSERQRNILRHQHIGGRSIDALAELYGVHRATAARWAAGARLALLDGTRERLTKSLGVDTRDADSIIRLVRSQLDISIGTLLTDS